MRVSLCMQFLYGLKILRTNHQCPRCRVPMALQECPATKYREGCCWKCTCGKTIAPRVGSILENSHVTYEEFIKILANFAEGKSVTSAAQHGNLAKDTVRRFYNKKHQRIAEDIITQTNIGGPGTVVDIDESKFGKQKYFYGRMVEGAWILGGIQRGNNHCFLTPCPGNLLFSDSSYSLSCLELRVSPTVGSPISTLTDMDTYTQTLTTPRTSSTPLLLDTRTRSRGRGLTRSTK